MVRYTGGTKNGVKRLSNDYQRYLSNKKAPVKSAILIDYNQFNYLIIRYLLADAEVFEDVAEDFVGGNFAGDFAEVMHGFAYVLGKEVAGVVVARP